MSKEKIFVIYDDSGAIRATAASSHENARVVARNGYRVHEIEHPGLSGDALMRHLVDLHRTHRIEPSDKPKVVRK